MKRAILFLFVVCLISTSLLNSQTKRVLLEQHTGAWCGWCVDGTYIMDQLLDLYPDRLIGVKIHNGDSMVIPEQAIIAQGIGLTGYPGGSIDRKSFNNTIAQSRTTWKAYSESQLAQQPKVDVSVTYNLNPVTRQLMVKVYSNMLTTVNEPLRFNVIIMEDSVSGQGTGWDQSNYLSGRSGYENNPYFDKPSKITGYQHMRVARKYLGGPWGEKGEFPQPAVQGAVYTHEFNYTIPERWKLHHLMIVGLVQVDSPTNKEVLNCAYGVEGEASIELTTLDPGRDVVNPGEKFSREYTLKNVANVNKTFDFTIDKSSRTPDDWEGNVEGNTFVLNAGNGLSVTSVTLSPGETYQFKLNIIPGETIGIGDIKVKIADSDDPDAFTGQGSITAYSSKIQKIEIVNEGEANYSLMPILNERGYFDFMTLNSSDFRDMSPKLNKKLLIWNTGVLDQMLTQDVNEVVNAIKSNIPVFVCGNHCVSGLENNSAMPFFGGQYNGYSTQGYGSAPYRVWLSGVKDDPISGSIGNYVEGNLIRYLITLVRIIDNEKTKAFMHFANPGLRVIYNPNTNSRDTFDIRGEDAIFGVRVDDGMRRSVLLSITPFVIVNQTTRNLLIDNILKWLNNEATDIDEMEITSTDINLAPIPASDFINFEISTDDVKSIRIYNSLGQIIDKIDNVNKGIFSYNASHLPSGTYKSVITTKTKDYVRQFVISK